MHATDMAYCVGTPMQWEEPSSDPTRRATHTGHVCRRPWHTYRVALQPAHGMHCNAGTLHDPPQDSSEYARPSSLEVEGRGGRPQCTLVCTPLQDHAVGGVSSSLHGGQRMDAICSCFGRGLAPTHAMQCKSPLHGSTCGRYRTYQPPWLTTGSKKFSAQCERVSP